MKASPTFFEFFAGGGMARAGLGSKWKCLFANDLDPKKSRTYGENWGLAELKTANVGELQPTDLPGCPDLVWASFPCQDLSLAGGGAGLTGERSGTFWPFWKQMRSLAAEKRAPKIIALENVCGTLSSHQGQDFAAICGALAQESYRFGATVIDAALFVPQSRPRLFIVAVRGDIEVPGELVSPGPVHPWHTKALRVAHSKVPGQVIRDWLWWTLPMPSPRQLSFSDLIETAPLDVEWHTAEQTRQLLGMMSELNRAKVEAAKASGRLMIGGVYKRTRRDELGRRLQRAEIRFDDIAGCLRTPAGGSSRQTIVVVEGNRVRSRLISARETARLMGLSDRYVLPSNYNEAYHLTGDGVVVPVVRYLAEHLFEGILEGRRQTYRVAA